MFLSTSELPPWRLVVFATLGIWLLAGAAFAVNSLIEKHIDQKMARTRMRPLPRGELSPGRRSCSPACWAVSACGCLANSSIR